ncbi:MAG: [FeFe] hydrogenase H-cluster maturation GTPase HydF [Halanaerobiales bacterium]
MNSTTRGERPHIAVFGRRNVGKSSLINKLTNQKLALVSSEAGTTTDPVYKSMELLPVGPVVMIDTAGIDDQGELGELRVKKTKEVMRKADLAILTISIKKGIAKFEKDLINEFKNKNIPFIAVINKSDLNNDKKEFVDKIIYFLENENIDYIKASAKKEIAIDKIRELIARKIPEDYSKNTIIGDLIEEGDVVVLVTPIDSSAPKGRLILPQVQTIRDILDHKGTALVTKKEEVASEVAKLKDKPKIVVTDSQAFQTVSDSLSDGIMLTGFSVLFARYKGDLKTFVNGVKAMENLKAGDKVLIAEACTHRRQKDDIGTVKIPNWIHEKISSKIQFDHVSGREFPENLSDYDLILHCGSCMLNRKEVLTRLNEAKSKGIAVVNYGMAIAYLHGILDRALEPFSKAALLWEKAEEVI